MQKKLFRINVIYLMVLFCLFRIFSFSNQNDFKTSDTARNDLKIGILTYVDHEILETIETGIIDEFKKAGYKDNQIKIYNANGEKEKVDLYAKEMAYADFDILIPISTLVSQAVIKSVNGKTPVVYSFVSNPESVGIKNLKTKPLNVTGISDVVNYQANISLLAKLKPDTKTIGVIYNPGEANSLWGIEECREICNKMNLKIEEATVSSAGEVIDTARLLSEKIDVFYVLGDNTVASRISDILKIAGEKKIAVFASDSGSVKAGACAAYSVDYKKIGKATANIAIKILKGKDINKIDPIILKGDTLVINKKSLEKYNISLPKELKSKVYISY